MDETKSLHVPIKAYLTELIESGQLQENALAPSENELAERFGVNRNWSRRALRELELEGYVVRSQGRRSVVAPISARRHALALGKAPTIAVALPDYLDLFDRSIVDGFMGYASSHDIHSLVYNMHLLEEEEDLFLRKAPDTGLAGLAVWPQHDTPKIAEALNTLRRRRFPIVQIDRYVTNSDTDFVVTDNEALGYTLANMLLDRGHTKIAYASVFENVSSVRDRFSGFKRALEEHNMPFDPKYHKCMTPDDQHSIHSAITEAMSYREAPTAFVCVHDNLAKSIAEELQRLDYAIPGHVELAAVDDVHESQLVGIQMVTARQRGHEMGRLAAELLVGRLYDPDLPTAQHFLPIDPDDNNGQAATNANVQSSHAAGAPGDQNGNKDSSGAN